MNLLAFGRFTYCFFYSEDKKRIPYRAMFKKHQDLTIPQDSATLWHYMSLPKFLHLLSSSSLFFRHIDGFKDKAEGKFTENDKNIVIKSIQGAPYEEGQREHFDNQYYVHCWTISGECEKSFWNEYAPGPYGVAIKSSVSRLMAAMNKDKEKDVYMGLVHYIDRKNGFTFQHYWEKCCYLDKCFSKDSSYAWEKELRLLHIANKNRLDKAVSGLLVKVDLLSLIDLIYVSPDAEQWFVSSLTDIIRLYEIGNKQVIIAKALR